MDDNNDEAIRRMAADSERGDDLNDEATPLIADAALKRQHRQTWIRTCCCCCFGNWKLNLLLWLVAVVAVAVIIRTLFLSRVATLVLKLFTALSSFSTCGSCFGLITSARQLAFLGDKTFVDTISGVCRNLKLQDPAVCNGAISRQGPVIAQTLRRIQPNKRAAAALCTKLWGMCDSHEAIEDWPQEMFPAPSIVRQPLPRSGRTQQVVHISDIHMDRDYIVGAESACNKPMCCRANSAANNGSVKVPAAHFGSPRCDTPVPLLRSMLEAIAKHAPKAAFVVSTGDIPNHSVWEETRDTVTEDLRVAYGLMRTTLPMPVYPIMGNHDVSPVNLLPRSLTNPKAFEEKSWVFDVHYDAWSDWIGHQISRQRFLKQRACYTMPVPGMDVRVISLDSNMANRDDFYYYDSDLPAEDLVDPEGMLTWLIAQLHDAESHGQRAIIIAHGHPVGYFKAQSHVFDQIVNRFRDTIGVQLYGHAHTSSVAVHYSTPADPRAETATSVSYIGGSLTPFGGVNPGFRVYDVDEVSGEVWDWADYYYDISKATDQQPEWKVLYRAREEYGSMVPVAKDQPLTAAFWHNVTTYLTTDSRAFDRFVKNKYRDGVAARRPCRGLCYLYTLCAMRRSRTEDPCPSFPPLPDHTNHTNSSILVADSADDAVILGRDPLLSTMDMRTIFEQVRLQAVNQK